MFRLCSFFFLILISLLLLPGTIQAAGNDCTLPETGPLTPIPIEGPMARVVFQGNSSLPYEDPPPGGSCASGKGQWVTVNWQMDFKIEDLESVFAKYNSDYLEGDFQDTSGNHQQTDFFNLNSSQWNNYNGPAQKLTPKIIFNQDFGETSGLKLKYVQYILDKSTRNDAKFTYTDVYGNGPALTIKQLYDKYCSSNPNCYYPPTEKSSAAEKELWANTWGRYWDKIPIAANDKATGKLGAAGRALDDWGNPKAPSEVSCPAPRYDLTIPEYFRTNRVSAGLNQLLLPKVAQSPLSNNSQDNSLANNESSSCSLHTSSAPALKPFKNQPVLLAATQTNFSPAGDVLDMTTIINEDHSGCHLTPPADQGDGDQFCMPDRISIISNNTNSRVFVCANSSTTSLCPGPPSGSCTPGEFYTQCLEGCPSGGIEEVWQCTADGEWGRPPGYTSQLNPACCGYTCSSSTTYTPGQKTVDIPIDMTVFVPYLKSIWNKSTSDLENKKTGFWGFFTPAVETGVILNQVQYEKHGETPNLDYESLGGNATFVPPTETVAYPDFIAGVKNAGDWVRRSLWPSQ